MSHLQTTLFSQQATISLHPLASLNILTHYTKSHQPAKTIGLILGNKANEITNSIPLKSEIYDDGSYWLDEEHLEKQLDVMNEKVIGWYLVDTQHEMTDNDVKVHKELMDSLATNPLFILFDVSFLKHDVKNPRVQMRAYRKTHLMFGNKILADKFERVAVQHAASVQEKVVLRAMTHKGASLENSLNDLQQNIQLILQYLQAKGKDSPQDAQVTKVAQMVQDALAELPLVQRGAFEKAFELCAQDFRMTSYLIQLMKNSDEATEFIMTNAPSLSSEGQ